MPKSWAIAASLARCCSIEAANSVGPATLRICPVAASRFAIVSSATARISVAIRWRNSMDKPGEAKKPIRPSIVSSGKPASRTVGMSGVIDARSEFVTASSLTFPDWRNGCTMARPVLVSSSASPNMQPTELLRRHFRRRARHQVFGNAGFIGNSTTSRKFSSPHNSMTMRSMPGAVASHPHKATWHCV
jgi:hypothetical protein